MSLIVLLLLISCFTPGKFLYIIYTCGYINIVADRPKPVIYIYIYIYIYTLRGLQYGLKSVLGPTCMSVTQWIIFYDICIYIPEIYRMD